MTRTSCQKINCYVPLSLEVKMNWSHFQNFRKPPPSLKYGMSQSPEGYFPFNKGFPFSLLRLFYMRKLKPPHPSPATNQYSTIIRNFCIVLGLRPHFVYTRLKRRKLDANREIHEATFDVPDAMKAYQDYHGFISQAKWAITGRGLLLDIHGQAHKPERTELGYLISRNNLNSGTFSLEETSIRSLANDKCNQWWIKLYDRIFGTLCFKDLIHGINSLGYFINQQDLDAVPSPRDMKPRNTKYFSGEYTAKKYGSRDGGDVDGIQMEFPKTLRKNWGKKSKDRVVTAIISFLKLNYPAILTDTDL